VTKERAIGMALLALILWSSPFIVASMVYSAEHYSLPSEARTAEKAAPAPMREAPPAPAPISSPEKHSGRLEHTPYP
jgi:hypothetical protein